MQRRLRSVFPANRETVAVTHVDKLDFLLTTRNDVGGNVEKQLNPFTDTTPPKANFDTVCKCHFPGTARVDVHTPYVKPGRQQSFPDVQVAGGNECVLSVRSAQSGQFRWHVPRGAYK